MLYLVVIGWLYVALMMAAAEAIAPNGSLLGAIFTFLLYGLGPVTLVVYLLLTPQRRARQRQAQEQAEAQEHAAGQAGLSESFRGFAPDTGSHAPGASVASVGEPAPRGGDGTPRG